MTKPRLFIGSSSESYDVASACNACMDRKVEVTLWDKIFEPGGNTLSSLLNKATNVDFALFIFNPEDITMMRNNSKPVIRDNVLFELGLFIGAIGKERCFILAPRDADFHMPTDLLGINRHDYDPSRTDNDLESAVNAACTRFINQINKLGNFKRQSIDLLRVQESPINHNFTISDDMMRILAKLLPTMTDSSK
ncbi:nucleotide-binding protein [uncultured Tolumonas sp.]|uniref:nucleotide-binding protein n=1 Tax=uncultured Tolumonas sp. TaxID=263765 RepID=UPI002A0A43BD|nr:nucleotide-binding protein [uncultured Tolumonas sp.]